MAVALNHGQFEHGAEPPDGSAWELFGERYERNPRLELDDGDLEMVRLWRLYREAHHLPDSGGTLEQSAVMMEAFDVMESAAAELQKRRDSRPRRESRR